jgi:DnaJ-class molecular chaperone
MNNNDNGFNKAQRDYDNQLPPEPESEITCPECKGTGCMAVLGDTAECEVCKGEGTIIDDGRARQEELEAYLENKADEAREERMIEGSDE